MKKTITITTVAIGYFFLMSSLGIIASVPGHVNKSAKEYMRNQISRSITCPDFITTNSETNTVKAVVSVDAQGKVSVGQINSGNPQLQQYVLARLQDMRVNNPAGPEKFVLVIHFKVD